MNETQNTFILDLKCAVCGIKTGEYTAPIDPEIAQEEITMESFGFSVRCDEHPEERVLTAPPLPEVPQKSPEELAAEDAAIANEGEEEQ